MQDLQAKLTGIDRNSEAVVLLHGLLRTGKSMEKAGHFFSEYGYRIINVEYPSRKRPVESLAVESIDWALEQCDPLRTHKIHFLTHSLGGILIRYYLSVKSIDRLGRVVMLAPPNQGSEIVDKLGSWRLFQFLNGPAGLQLGTRDDSLPNSLGSISCQVGVIAGNKAINPFLSLLIPGDNDGKVSVRRSQVEGMVDFIVVPYSHTFIMQRRYVLEQSLHFIQHGRFCRSKTANRSVPS
ncbi:MAG: esterase/lipase family protein [Gammaproteobacteria bacterium]